jgi:GntR family transcriptional regulator/MocR family aminotransferase
LSDCQRSLLEQCVLADFITKGYLESHIRRMRSDYEQRRQILIQSFNQHLGKQITILGENAGIHLMARLQTHLSDQEIIQRMAQAGIEMISTQPHYCNVPRSGEFIFGYAALTEQQIQKSVYKLAQILKEEQRRI